MRKLLMIAGVIALVSAACTNADTSTDAPPSTSTAPAEASAATTTPSSPEASAAGTAPAPEFPDGLDWLNVAQPLDLETLHGKVVLLDFWTYGCINCIHIIPDLKRLEAEFPNELVVIGVHSAKFANEGETDNIREVIRRYDLRHPVVNDVSFEVWNSWGVRAWPTVALIDPAGNAVGVHAGEGVYEVVQPVISNLVAEFSATGVLDLAPLPVQLEQDRSPNTVLSYPGKIHADPSSERLFIADTGHHQIVAATDDGTVTAVFGSGLEGFDDGIGTHASFSSPQGLVVDGDTLYVADTNNHAIRQIDLPTGAVTTLVGTGAMGWPPTGGALDDVALNSPWALELSGDLLYVANAGTHQIWTIDLKKHTATPSVGSAAEGTANGPLLEATLAQPSGLAFDHEGVLYFADSESSSVRSAAVGVPDGATGLVAGGSANLFEFGDQDGTGTEARFQHPLGIAWHDGRLLVADTYNSKIKSVDLSTREAVSVFGAESGWSDGPDPLFYEPGGLSVDGNVLWVADTNNHAIRRIDLTTGIASTVVPSGLGAFLTTPRADDFPGMVVTLATVSAGVGAADLVLDVRIPDGFKVNEEASSSLFLLEDGGVASFPDGDRVDLTGTTFPLTIPIDLHEGLGTITADLALVWCRKDAEGLCLFEQTRFEIPLHVSASGPSASIRLSLELETPEL
ncbi:MAG: thioredoxin-like domain-containing protein [Actinomycetota bacterium]|nr:thioredoxin-like domain-containing protein [Actinomycetota bacterium]